MVNLLQRDKNVKDDQPSLLPYEKAEVDGESTKLDEKTSVDDASKTQGRAMTGAEFLLSIAGKYSSGTTDTSERIEEYIEEIIKEKYS